MARRRARSWGSRRSFSLKIVSRPLADGDARVPVPEIHVEPPMNKELRLTLGSSRPGSAKLLRVVAGRLRNWEQGRRAPTGLPRRS